MAINLIDRRLEIITTADHWFDRITSLPTSVRKDEKERTGIQVLVREPDTRNLVFVSIRNPSEAAQFFAAEKAVRSHLYHQSTSGNSALPEKMAFSGSVTCFDDHGSTQVQASCSGLLSEEDVMVGIMELATVFKTSPNRVCDRVTKIGGVLPDVFYDHNHYLYEWLHLIR